jgi:hypothetical protein
MKKAVESENKITSANYFLTLSENQQVISMITPLGILPQVYRNPHDPSDEKEERKCLMDARFHFSGIAFTCLGILINPNNEHENFVISKIEGDVNQEEKFIKSIDYLRKRFHFTVEKLDSEHSREFFNTYSGYFQPAASLEEV